MYETIYVTSEDDSGSGTLREAIKQANQKQASHIIIKRCVKRIQLSSQIVISSNIKISNEDHDVMISGQTRIFKVTKSRFLKIESDNNKIILSNGTTTKLGGAIYVKSSDHTTTLQNVAIINNRASQGGGIYTKGKLILISSILTLNKAVSQGGAIWCELGMIAIKSIIDKNYITGISPSNCGAGIFVDNGDCVIDSSKITNNHVAYDASNGGSGGGIVVMTGSIYLQNNSHVDHNTAYQAGGIQQGTGNVYLNDSSSSNNKSFSPNIASGGGGIVIVLGSVYLSNSEICNNHTSGMYSGGLVSLVGNVVITNSKICGNTNTGPGGAIALNIGTGTIVNSKINDNTGASLGGALVTFSPDPALISITNSEISNNTLTNAQTIRQTVEAFLKVITQQLSSMDKQAKLAGGSGSKNMSDKIPGILKQLTTISDALKTLPRKNLPTIAGGAISSLLTSHIMIESSQISNNYAGQLVSKSNVPFTAYGGGIFGYNAKINIQNSSITDNTSLSNGGGIWSRTNANINNTKISENKIKVKGDGGGLYLQGPACLMNSTITENIAKGTGGGVKSDTPFFNYNTTITDNIPDNI